MKHFSHSLTKKQGQLTIRAQAICNMRIRDEIIIGNSNKFTNNVNEITCKNCLKKLRRFL